MFGAKGKGSLLDQLQACSPSRAAELTLKLLQEQQETINGLHKQLANHELWRAKTERTIADLQQQISKLGMEGERTPPQSSCVRRSIAKW